MEIFLFVFFAFLRGKNSGNKTKLSGIIYGAAEPQPNMAGPT